MPETFRTLPSLVHSTGSDDDPGGDSGEPCLSDDEILAYAQGELLPLQLNALHRHADNCSTCQRLLGEAAQALDAELSPQSGRTSWNTVFQPNSLIAKRYRVVRLVARGGMGEVYEAFDTALHERVALKTVTSTACDNIRAVRALKAEVLLARRITHPNVCRIFDLGTHVVAPTGNEIHFLVMEFVEGECLGKKLRASGALPFEDTVSVARQLLLGLRAAHRAGILHRDFKSENVILRRGPDGQLNPVILDFGLAKALNENGAIATTQSHVHEMVGTISYMAPEQIEGAPLSRASDLYALGVVWFEMLTGRLPFEAASPAASALARLHRDAEAPSAIVPTVPQWLDAIVLRCLSRERGERFGTAQQVLDAIAAAALNPPVETAPIRPTWGRSRTRGLAMALAAFVGCALIGWQFSTRSGALANRWPRLTFHSLERIEAPPSVRDGWGPTLSHPEVHSAAVASNASAVAESAAARAGSVATGATPFGAIRVGAVARVTTIAATRVAAGAATRTPIPEADAPAVPAPTQTTVENATTTSQRPPLLPLWPEGKRPKP